MPDVMISDVSSAEHEQAAELLALGVPQEQIAIVTGLSEGRISQLKNEAWFQKLVQEKGTKYIKQQNLLNDGWNRIEELALGTLLEYLDSVTA